MAQQLPELKRHAKVANANGVVWAKLPGYPFWPAKKLNEAEVKDKNLPAPTSSCLVPVVFFGTRDYSWIKPANLKGWDVAISEGLQQKKYSGLSKALDEVLVFLKKPSFRPEFEERFVPDDAYQSQEASDRGVGKKKTVEYYRAKLVEEVVKAGGTPDQVGNFSLSLRVHNSASRSDSYAYYHSANGETFRSIKQVIQKLGLCPGPNPAVRQALSKDVSCAEDTTSATILGSKRSREEERQPDTPSSPESLPVDSTSTDSGDSIQNRVSVARARSNSPISMKEKTLGAEAGERDELSLVQPVTNEAAIGVKEDVEPAKRLCIEVPCTETSAASLEVVATALRTGDPPHEPKPELCAPLPTCSSVTDAVTRAAVDLVTVDMNSRAAPTIQPQSVNPVQSSRSRPPQHPKLKLKGDPRANRMYDNPTISLTAAQTGTGSFVVPVPCQAPAQTLGAVFEQCQRRSLDPPDVTGLDSIAALPSIQAPIAAPVQGLQGNLAPVSVLACAPLHHAQAALASLAPSAELLLSRDMLQEVVQRHWRFQDAVERLLPAVPICASDPGVAQHTASAMQLLLQVGQNAEKLMDLVTVCIKTHAASLQPS